LIQNAGEFLIQNHLAQLLLHYGPTQIDARRDVINLKPKITEVKTRKIKYSPPGQVEVPVSASPS
jgi:hypothetical protein